MGAGLLKTFETSTLNGIEIREYDVRFAFLDSQGGEAGFNTPNPIHVQQSGARRALSELTVVDVRPLCGRTVIKVDWESVTLAIELSNDCVIEISMDPNDPLVAMESLVGELFDGEAVTR